MYVYPLYRRPRSITSIVVIMTVGNVMMKNLGEASFCSVAGDSGAPVFASHQAFGLENAVTADSKGNPIHPCQSFYQGILGAAQAMNVNIVFAR